MSQLKWRRRGGPARIHVNDVRKIVMKKRIMPSNWQRFAATIGCTRNNPTRLFQPIGCSIVAGRPRSGISRHNTGSGADVARLMLFVRKASRSYPGRISWRYEPVGLENAAGISSNSGQPTGRLLSNSLTACWRKSSAGRGIIAEPARVWRSDIDAIRAHVAHIEFDPASGTSTGETRNLRIKPILPNCPRLPASTGSDPHHSSRKGRRQYDVKTTFP